MKRSLVVISMLLCLCVHVSGAEPASDIRCEGLVDPIGIDVRKPRLSWQMQADHNGAAQKAYRILCATAPGLLKEGAADLWDSGKVVSNQSQHIAYAGKELSRGVPCYWKVRIWNEDGNASVWSKPGKWTWFDMPSNEDWQAKWITYNRDLRLSTSPWLRQTVELKEAPSKAYVYVNALGYFKLFINGKRVGRDEFTPHVGQLNKRTFCVAYDVTEYLQKGKNAVGFWLGSGWNLRGAGISSSPSVRAQLEMTDASGKATILVTDEKWRAKPSSMAYRGRWKWNHYGGEVHTASLDQPDWADADFDDSSWSRAVLVEGAGTVVSSEMLQRNRVVETIAPVKVTALAADGSWFVDMGKAMTGTLEITFPKAEKGHKVSMEFGDSYNLTKDGKIDKLNSFNQVSEYICRGSGVETFRNQFNYASCRYILIANAPKGDLSPEDIKGYFITTDLPKASAFHCSNETLNGIYTMMDHTLRCLMLGGYQVDCHSRERYGYGGDGHSSLDTTLCFLRSDAFYRKWTRDWLDGQKKDGGFTYTSPASGHGGGPFWCGFLTAATLKHYHHYGDISVIKRNYPAIKKWFELAQSKTVNNLQNQFCFKWYLGDWASPRGIDDKANAQIFIHAYMAYALEQVAQLADVLGKTADAGTFRQWAAARNAATHKEYFNSQSKQYGSGDQVTYVLPLMSGVVPDDLHDDVFAGFEETLMKKNSGHLSTGLSGTYMMVQYLQSIGRDDLIYSFASKKTYPSWGYMIEQGATATWEYWAGHKGTRIHNCYNNIGSWFIQGLAGIRPDPKKPGFQNAIIKPAFIKDLNFVNGSHDSLYGTIESNWKREGDGIIMTVKVPANSTATVYAPEGDVTINGRALAKAEHVKVVRMEAGRAVVNVGSGIYTFVSKRRKAKPNVLLIAIDDLNDWIGCMGGHPQAKTPNIDRLAARGVLFNNAQCQSPVCNPSRASMMTSLYPSTSGIYFLNPDLKASPVARKNKLMPQRFVDEGYYVTGAGKLFHGNQNQRYMPNYAGRFGAFGPMPKKKITSFPGHPLWDWGVYPQRDDQMPDHKIAAWGVEQLHKKPRSTSSGQAQPLFLGVGFYRPHVPQYAPQKWFDMYPRETLQLPKVIADDLKDISRYGINITRLNHVSPTHEWVLKNNEWKPLVQSYLACVSFVDHQVGKLLDALEKSDYKDNTIIVLYTDHGFHLGEKERWAKRSLWEDGARVPMIIAGPGIAKGRKCKKPVQLLDIYPTLLDLTGHKADPLHEGHSLAPLLKNPEAEWTHMARTCFGPGNYAIVSERYRFIQYNDGSEEFYDRIKDPHEWNNAVKNPEYADVVKLHRSQIPQKRHRVLGRQSTGHKSYRASELRRDKK